MTKRMKLDMDGIIGEFGSMEKMGNALGIPKTTISTWKILGTVPLLKAEIVGVKLIRLGINPEKYGYTANDNEPQFSHDEA